MPRPPSSGVRFVSTADLVTAAVRLGGVLPPDVGGVAGIPRSGMIPAAVIATHLHLPLWELSNGVLRPIAAGTRERTLKRTPRLAVVDDTVYNGVAIRRARSDLSHHRPAPLFAAVFVRPGTERFVDLAGEILPPPHLLAWNLLNGGWTMWPDGRGRRGLGVDLDGVLCHDEYSGGVVGTPYLLHRTHPAPLIATGRQERHRRCTAEWLNTWGVRYHRLAMLNDDADPTDWRGIAAHKARACREAGVRFFVESAPEQAEIIARLGGLPVVCPRAGRVF